MKQKFDLFSFDGAKQTLLIITAYVLLIISAGVMENKELNIDFHYHCIENGNEN